MTSQERADAWLAAFERALRARDPDAAARLFAADSYWRDLVSFSWNIVTVEGRHGVAAMLGATLDRIDPHGFATTAEPSEANGVTEAWFRFETAAGRGVGHLRLAGEHAYTLLTTLHELKGRDVTRETAEPYVLVVGGGQAGITLGARLRRLGVPSLVLDRRDRPGDQWRERYASLTLHDPVWYDHLPYLPFPPGWPVYASKDRIADWLEAYVRVMDVPYRGRSTVRSARREGDRWVVEVDHDGEAIELHPAELVFATGMLGKPNRPVFPGQDVFRGEQHHSSEHPGPQAYAGRRVVVVGSGNSAFDIGGALCEHDAEVTMVQRSPTLVVTSRSLTDLFVGRLYAEHGLPTETADLVFASTPYRIMPKGHAALTAMMAERDADFYRRLGRAGFAYDLGPDGSGMFMQYLRTASGYYIDTGAAELVADGRIGVARGEVDHLTEDAVVLSDGTVLPADLVVYATGYGSMSDTIAEVAGRETAQRVGRVWGLGSDTPGDPGPWEGEERNMWKPTREPGLWLHGGNLHQNRHYSHFLALQLKARYEGIPTPIYPAR